MTIGQGESPIAAPIEVWAGIECTLNRVGDAQRDQLALTGHYDRTGDLELLAALGVRTIRYPVLWERVAADGSEEWKWHDTQLARMQQLGIEPIIGLVHHGSGPLHTHLLDCAFAEGLARFARLVAARYPWVTRFTPVNEPLTTARFSALYGLWFPHARDDASFVRAELNQIRAVRLAMAAIREVTPSALLIQTEDLGYTHATDALAYQAQFENERRWFTFDLLTGRVVRGHRMYDHALSLGITEDEIQRATGDGCAPDVVGVNHYVTSERWLDERIDRYPVSTIGGNDRERYADVEAVRVVRRGGAGLERLLGDVWQRYRLPVAVTEVHMGCTREQQLRWLRDAWQAAAGARRVGADVRAVTAWAAFGAQDWPSLLIRCDGAYEPGLFDVRSPTPRATALAQMAASLAVRAHYDHPVLDEDGWWHRPERLSYGVDDASVTPAACRGSAMEGRARTILVTGAAGTLGSAFVRLCRERGLAVHATTRHELDITDTAAIHRVLTDERIWAVVNAAGYVRVDDAEYEQERCRDENVTGPLSLAAACATRGVRLLTFSSDLVFDGRKGSPYVESDPTAPLGVYGATKVEMEQKLSSKYNDTLIVRTAAFFGPWDDTNFLTQTLGRLVCGMDACISHDAVVSPTFVPDLVHAALDLLIDGERGIWHLANQGAVSWAEFARMAACSARLDASLIQLGSSYEVDGFASRPANSALESVRATILPSIENAIDRYVRDQPWLRASRSLLHNSDLNHAAHSYVA